MGSIRGQRYPDEPVLGQSGKELAGLSQERMPRVGWDAIVLGINPGQLVHFEIPAGDQAAELGEAFPQTCQLPLIVTIASSRAFRSTLGELLQLGLELRCGLQQFALSHSPLLELIAFGRQVGSNGPMIAAGDGWVAMELPPGGQEALAGGQLAELRAGPGNCICTDRIDFANLFDRLLPLGQQPRNVVGDSVIVLAQMLHRYRCCLVAKLAILVGEFIANDVQVLADAGATFADFGVRLLQVGAICRSFRLDSRGGLFDPGRQRIGPLQSLLGGVIRMLRRSFQCLGPLLHLIAQLQTLLLNLILQCSPAGQLHIDQV